MLIYLKVLKSLIMNWKELDRHGRVELTYYTRMTPTELGQQWHGQNRGTFLANGLH